MEGYGTLTLLVKLYDKVMTLLHQNWHTNKVENASWFFNFLMGRMTLHLPFVTLHFPHGVLAFSKSLLHVHAFDKSLPQVLEYAIFLLQVIT